MIYLDTSVALAELFAEDRRPSRDFWKERFVASRLLEYEVWTRVHARGASKTHGDAAREVLGSVALVELTAPVLARATEPFEAPVRTLDALHLATALYLSERRQKLRVATYDLRMARAAEAVGLEVFEPPSI